MTTNTNRVTKAQLLEENEQLRLELEELKTKKFGEELRPGDYVTITSLCPFQLNLSTLGYGKGKTLTFREFGERKKILYSDLLLIMEAHDGFLKAGYFYINEPRVIHEHNLYYIYDKILKEDQLRKIFNLETDFAISVYQNANERQRKLIEDWVVNKLADGEEINMNFVSGISNLSGRKIVEASEDLKAKRISN